MFQKHWLAAIALGTLIGSFSITAQEPPPPTSGNNEIIRMLSSSVPESTVLAEIEVMAGRGVSFDISPAAITELQRRGASEKLMNYIVWAQTTIVPGIDIPMARGVFYRSGTNETPLNSFMLWAEFSPRWSTWPFYSPSGKKAAQSASPAVVQVSDTTPTLVVQGFSGQENWQLVRIGRSSDHREMRLKTNMPSVTISLATLSSSAATCVPWPSRRRE